MRTVKNTSRLSLVFVTFSREDDLLNCCSKMDCKNVKVWAFSSSTGVKGRKRNKCRDKSRTFARRGWRTPTSDRGEED